MPLTITPRFPGAPIPASNDGRKMPKATPLREHQSARYISAIILLFAYGVSPSNGCSSVINSPLSHPYTATVLINTKALGTPFQGLHTNL